MTAVDSQTRFVSLHIRAKLGSVVSFPWVNDLLHMLSMFLLTLTKNVYRRSVSRVFDAMDLRHLMLCNNHWTPAPPSLTFFPSPEFGYKFRATEVQFTSTYLLKV